MSGWDAAPETGGGGLDYGDSGWGGGDEGHLGASSAFDGVGGGDGGYGGAPDWGDGAGLGGDGYGDMGGDGYGDMGRDGYGDMGGNGYEGAYGGGGGYGAEGDFGAREGGYDLDGLGGQGEYGAGGYDGVGGGLGVPGNDSYGDHGGYGEYGAESGLGGYGPEAGGYEDPLSYGLGEASALGHDAEAGLERGYDDLAQGFEDHREGFEEAGELALAGLAGGAAGYALGHHGSGHRDRDLYGEGYDTGGLMGRDVGYGNHPASTLGEGGAFGYGDYATPRSGHDGRSGYDAMGDFGGHDAGLHGYDANDYHDYHDNQGHHHAGSGFDYANDLANHDTAMLNHDTALLNRDNPLDASLGYDNYGYGSADGYHHDGLGAVSRGGLASDALERDFARLDLAEANLHRDQERVHEMQDANLLGRGAGYEGGYGGSYRTQNFYDDGELYPRVYGSHGYGGIYGGSGYGGLDATYDTSYYGGLSQLYHGHDSFDLFGGYGSGRGHALRSDPFSHDIPLDYGYGRIQNLESYGLSRNSLTSFDALRMDDLYLYEQAIRADHNLNEAERMRRWNDRLRWESMNEAQRRQQWRMMSLEHRSRLGLGNGGWWATQFGASRIDPTYGYSRPLIGSGGLLSHHGLRRGIRHYPLNRELAGRFPIWQRGGVGLGRSLLHWLETPSRHHGISGHGHARIGAAQAALQRARMDSAHASRERMRATQAVRDAEMRHVHNAAMDSHRARSLAHLTSRPPPHSSGPITTLSGGSLSNLHGGLRRTLSTPMMRPPAAHSRTMMPTGAYTLSGRRVGPGTLPGRSLGGHSLSGGVLGHRPLPTGMGARTLGGGMGSRPPLTSSLSAPARPSPSMMSRLGGIGNRPGGLGGSRPLGSAQQSLAARVLAARRGQVGVHAAGRPSFPGRGLATGIGHRPGGPLPGRPSLSHAGSGLGALRSPLRPGSHGWGAPPPHLRPGVSNMGQGMSAHRSPMPRPGLSRAPGSYRQGMGMERPGLGHSRTLSSISRSAPPPYGSHAGGGRTPRPDVGLADRARAALAAHAAASTHTRSPSRVGLPQPPAFPSRLPGASSIGRSKSPAALLRPTPSRPSSSAALLGGRPASAMRSRTPVPSPGRSHTPVPTISRARSPAIGLRSPAMPSLRAKSPGLSPGAAMMRPKSPAASIRSRSPAPPKSPALRAKSPGILKK